MPVYRMTDSGPGRYRSRTIDGTLTPGDTVTVDGDAAAGLEARDYFERVDDATDESADTSEDDSASDESPADGSESDETFDEDEWLDDDYTDRAEQVRSGEVDANLETIDEIETSGKVRDAIGERRAELEE